MNETKRIAYEKNRIILIYDILYDELMDVYKNHNIKKIRFVYYYKNKLSKISNAKIVFDNGRIFVASENIDAKISNRVDLEYRDFDEDKNVPYEFHTRIVRFKITDDTYECIMTNLSRDEFSLEEIKELYHKRWGIETSFRELKYAIGLSALHSKKRELIKQEIYARLILYNFSQRVIQKIQLKKQKRKYIYQVNFTRAFHIIREFLRKKSGKPLHVESLIAKEILPVRPNRSNIRKSKTKAFVFFNYRFD